MDSTTMKGTVQGYFDRAFDEMTDKELETPLANSGLGVKAKLAPNSGTFVQFRKFGDLALATEANSDSPKMYGETEEPSASMVVPDDIFQVSTQDLAGYLSFRPKLLLQDPSDIMAVSKRRLNRWVRRMIHTVVNDRFVRPLAVAVTNLDSAYVAAPKPFRMIYAGGAAAFAGMREDSFVTIADIFRGAALLRNGRAPSIDGRYACVMDSAGIEQIKFGDSKFTDLIKGFEDKNNRVFGAGDMIDYGGVAFVRQDDPYRCNLPDVGGAVQTRCNTGKVRVAHLFGANAFGYLDLGEAGSPTRRTLAPTFKCQDITITGTLLTCAVRMGFQAMVVERNFGLNLAYTSAFDEVPTDLPDEAV